MTKFLAKIHSFLLSTTRSGGTIRYMFPMFVGFLTLLGAAVISSIDSSYIKLVPSETVIMNGEQFAVGVYAYAHVPANAVDITVSFDPSSVEIMGVDKGQSVLTIWTQEPKISNGGVNFAGGTFRRGFVGEHLIATINLMAKKDGNTEVFVKDAALLAGDGKGTPVTLSESAQGTQSFIIYNQGTDPSTLEADVRLSISADIDGDGTVTLRDISAFMASWYRGDTTYDFNDDRKMNFVDFSIILARSFFKSSE